jgi:hypothetical protein
MEERMKTKIPKETGEKLLRWEKEGIMQASLEENRWMLNFYKAQLEKENKTRDKKAYIKRKEIISITTAFKKEWREHRRECWRRREEWAAQYKECVIVNKWFKGCEKHHISKFLIVCIPKNLHRSMFHSLRTGKNMKRINDLVFEWLELQQKVT